MLGRLGLAWPDGPPISRRGAIPAGIVAVVIARVEMKKAVSNLTVLVDYYVFPAYSTGDSVANQCSQYRVGLLRIISSYSSVKVALERPASV